MAQMINIAEPIIESAEIKAVNAVLRSGTLAMGPKTAEFEANFAAYCGTKYAVALNSGTAAIHSALFAVGIGKGDEVITTPFSFMATLNPILMLGARPILVDIDPSDFNLNPDKIEAAITPKTKAIIAVDLYGQPFNYAAIAAIAKKHQLVLIEDACQAIGAIFNRQKTGSLGKVACFSLYATKNITSGQGGVLTTNDAQVAATARRFRQHGLTTDYEYAELGYNYRMIDILAAIAIEQLKKVDQFNTARQRNAAILSEGLSGLTGIIVPEVIPGRSHVFHQYTIRITGNCKVSRQEIMDQLQVRGIGSGIYYPKPLHFYPHVAKLGYKKGDFPVAEQAAREVLSLPVHPKVTVAQAHQIAAAVRDIVSG